MLCKINKPRLSFAQPLVTTHSESVPLQILPLMGSDQISANSSEGSVVIRGQYFAKPYHLLKRLW